MLNSVVSAYLEFAEIQARIHIAIYMKDWIETLDGFLKLSRHEILTNAGSISAAVAEKKAKEEYQKYRALQDKQPDRAELDCVAALENSEKHLLDNREKS